MEKIVQGIDVKDCEYIYTDRDNDLCCAASIGGDSLCDPAQMMCPKYLDHLRKQLQAKEQEIKRVKKENQYHVNTYCHFKNEIKKYKKAVHKYKAVVQDKIERLHLSRREFLREINSVPVRIACRGEGFKNALNNFNNAIQVINNEDKYKQALDKIEAYCNVILADRCHYSEGAILMTEKLMREYISKTKE